MLKSVSARILAGVILSVLVTGTCYCEELCVPRIQGGTEPASNEQLFDEWGDCVPRIECVSISRESEVKLKVCECSEDASHSSCVSNCKTVKADCKGVSARYENSCPSVTELKEQKECIFDGSKAEGSRCSGRESSVELLCGLVPQGAGKAGIRVIDGCVTPLLLDSGRRGCVGMNLTEVWRPSVEEPTRCEKDSSATINVPKFECR